MRILLLGDLGYPTLKKIFDRSEEVDLAWDVLLAPHHCSKSAMYEREDGQDILRRDILDAIEAAASDGATISKVEFSQGTTVVCTATAAPL